ncbi:hypothetical protein EG68_05146 [Paragonimus skrjabini miyazakii]|uniref:Tetraspanin n=1 Tax=Paragonimus skrjabini miyazakii TaxID=59628 RepID=A0A8S9Z2I3_9TREM|nr:hypothetical protein EG68_05146 [Paragonimus skrjabini miyazakii]
MSSVVNLADKEAAIAYSRILRPMIYVFFTHQLIILINISFVLLGTCYRSVFLTHVSIVAMVLITLIEAIGFGYYLTNIQNWESKRTIQALGDMRPQFMGANSSNFQTFLFNFIHQRFQCCGIHSYTEWLNPTYNWSRQITYNGHVYDLRLPISCCSIVTSKQVPTCALMCSTEEPFEKGCASYFSHMTLFRATQIPEKYYAIPFLIMHMLLVFIYIWKVMLISRIRTHYRGTATLPTKSVNELQHPIEYKGNMMNNKRT